MDEGEVREAVLVLLRLDEEEDPFAVLVEEVVVGVDLVVVRRGTMMPMSERPRASAANFLSMNV
jgi:hypothetical protein